MYALTVLTFLVGHNELQVISTTGDVVIDEQTAITGWIKVFPGHNQNLWVRTGMSYITPNISLDYT